MRKRGNRDHVIGALGMARDGNNKYTATSSFYAPHTEQPMYKKSLASLLKDLWSQRGCGARAQARYPLANGSPMQTVVHSASSVQEGLPFLRFDSREERLNTA